MSYFERMNIYRPSEEINIYGAIFTRYKQGYHWPHVSLEYLRNRELSVPCDRNFLSHFTETDSRFSNGDFFSLNPDREGEKRDRIDNPYFFLEHSEEHSEEHSIENNRERMDSLLESLLYYIFDGYRDVTDAYNRNDILVSTDTIEYSVESKIKFLKDDFDVYISSIRRRHVFVLCKDVNKIYSLVYEKK